MPRKGSRLAAVGAIAAAFVSAPATATELKINLPPPVTVSPLPTGVRAQPFNLTRVGANIAPGSPWLEESEGVACIVWETTYWKESNNRIGLDTFDRVFRREMVALGFGVGPDSTSLFEDRVVSDLQVGALVTGIAVRGCRTPAFLHGANKMRASGTMDVEWQIYSAAKGSVIARVTTHGGFTDAGVDMENIAPIVTSLFGDNVRRLAADPTFRGLIAAPPASSASPSQHTDLPITFIPATTRQPIAKAGQGVVTVFAGEGWGSGILISADGYILTNHHVAAAGDRARIRWSDGTETPGEVLRSDKRRDVALIRTTGRAAALAIRHDTPQLGEAVFAIGTPLEKSFQNTVTRGVVSGVRSIEGQSFIQSDVAVDHGNSGGPLLDEQGRVIGITDWGYSPDGVSHSLNFFIPIDDALKVLSLTPVPTADLHEPVAPARLIEGVKKRQASRAHPTR